VPTLQVQHPDKAFTKIRYREVGEKSKKEKNKEGDKKSEN
jgi:hypothetical protein